MANKKWIEAADWPVRYRTSRGPGSGGVDSLMVEFEASAEAIGKCRVDVGARVLESGTFQFTPGIDSKVIFSVGVGEQVKSVEFVKP